MTKISVVINILNEEKYIERVLESVKWADEIIIVDDGSSDRTLDIVKEFRIKNLELRIFKHKSKGYVEPARNFAISKASGDWVLVLDADEEISNTLASKLKEIVESNRNIDFVEIPRKNIIFGKWMKASMWWPDTHIRFFKKGYVMWSDRIHIPPEAKGKGLKLEQEEKWSLIHHHYENISQFLERLNRYTQIQSKELVRDGYKFDWRDLIVKPAGEFLGRFFANRGFEDGFHGLALSLLQAFSFLIVYLRVWEVERFSQRNLELKELREVKNKIGDEINYWFKYENLSRNPIKRFVQRIKNKIK